MKRNPFLHCPVQCGLSLSHLLPSPYAVWGVRGGRKGGKGEGERGEGEREGGREEGRESERVREEFQVQLPKL